MKIFLDTANLKSIKKMQEVCKNRPRDSNWIFIKLPL